MRDLSVGVWRHRRTAEALVAIAASLLGVLFAGCAGPSGVTTPVPRLAAERLEGSALVSRVDLPSTTMDKCVYDDDYIQMVHPIPGNNQRLALVSRHVDCRAGESGLIELRASRRAADDRWNSVTRRGDDVVGAGTIRVASKMSVYGPSNGLQKRISLTMRVIEYTPDPSHPGQGVLPRVLLTPMFECGPSTELLGGRPVCTVTGEHRPAP